MSTIKVNTIQTTGGTEVYTVKVWVLYNQAATLSIRGSGGVSSMTDVGPGVADVNFSSSFSGLTYSATAAAGRGSNVEYTACTYNNTSSASLNRIHVQAAGTSTNADVEYVSGVFLE